MPSLFLPRAEMTLRPFLIERVTFSFAGVSHASLAATSSPLMNTRSWLSQLAKRVADFTSPETSNSWRNSTTCPSGDSLVSQIHSGTDSSAARADEASRERVNHKPATPKWERERVDMRESVIYLDARKNSVIARVSLPVR